jgi:hypothetical protein
VLGVGCFDLNEAYRRCSVPFCEDLNDQMFDPMDNADDPITARGADSSVGRGTDSSTVESGISSNSSNSSFSRSNSDDRSFDIASIFEDSIAVLFAPLAVWARTVNVLLALWLLCT